MKTYSVGGLYLNAQVVVTASGLCSGVHFAQRQHSDTPKTTNIRKEIRVVKSTC